jgi:hypothetical protein
MPVDGPYHDAWRSHIDRGERGNPFQACPFVVVSGRPDIATQIPLQATGFVVRLSPP